MKDLRRYKRLSAEDSLTEKWRKAPIVVLTNAERFDLMAERAISFAKEEETVVLRWKKNVLGWKNKPNLVHEDDAEEDPVLWEYFVPGAEGYITTNIQTDKKVVNGSPIIMHSVSLGSSVETEDLYNSMREAAPGETSTSS